MTIFNWEMYLHEFEDAQGNTGDDDQTEDEEFSMDDDTEAGETTEQPAEDTTEEAPEGDEDEEYSVDDEGEDQPEEEGDDEPPEGEEDEDYEIPDDEESEGNDTGEAPEAGDDEEFSMDDDAGSGEEGESTGDDSFGDTEGEDTTPEDETNTKLKELEAVVFEDLSEEEKKMKIKDLKELYITVYKKCGTISELLSEIRRDEETIQIIEYISNTLIDLKHYVNDYINDVFDAKTYIENLSQLQKYIMIFNAINKVFSQIKDENNQ